MSWAKTFPLGTSGELLLNDTGDTIARAYMRYEDPAGPSNIQVAVAFTLNGVREGWRSYWLSNQPGWQEVRWSYVQTTQIMSFHLADTGTTQLGGAFDYSYPIYRGSGSLEAVRIRVGSEVKMAIPFVKVAGVWRSVTPFAKHAGEWKRTY